MIITTNKIATLSFTLNHLNYNTTPQAITIRYGCSNGTQISFSLHLFGIHPLSFLLVIQVDQKWKLFQDCDYVNTIHV